MTSKERLEEIRKQLEKTCLKNCGHGSNENCICLNNQYANLEHLEKDLEVLETIKNSGYSVINKNNGDFILCFNAPDNDTINKIKEWLENGKD